jgi:hypothetical protein
MNKCYVVKQPNCGIVAVVEHEEKAIDIIFGEIGGYILEDMRKAPVCRLYDNNEKKAALAKLLKAYEEYDLKSFLEQAQAFVNITIEEVPFVESPSIFSEKNMSFFETFSKLV